MPYNNIPYYYNSYQGGYAGGYPGQIYPNYTPPMMNNSQLSQDSMKPSHEQYFNGGLAYVKNIEEVQKFVVQPNYCVFLMSTSQPVLYKKWVDSNGNPYMEAYSITPYEESQKKSTEVTKDSKLESIEKKIDGIISFLTSLSKSSEKENTTNAESSTK